MDRKDQKYSPQEILAEIAAYKELRRNRIRHRFKLGLQFGAVLTGVLFVLWCTISRTEDRIELDRFNNICSSIKDGQLLEAVRGLASEQQLLFEEDSGSSSLTPHPIYVMRPSASWPERFGCRFEAREARVYRKQN